MKFDVRKFKEGSGYYSEMSKEKLAFNDALKRMIWSDGDHIEWHEYKDGKVSAKIIIDMDGRISAKTRYKHTKSGFVRISEEELRTVYDGILQFFSVCIDHGYLIPEPPKESDNA